jgi:hypothetical protein
MLFLLEVVEVVEDHHRHTKLVEGVVVDYFNLLLGQ